MKFSSAAPLRWPGMTSRLTNGLSGPELPISRQSSTHAIAAFISSGCANVLASIAIGSQGLAPVRRTRPRLFGRTRPANNVQGPAGGLKRAAVSRIGPVDAGSADRTAAQPLRQDHRSRQWLDRAARARLPQTL